MVTRFNYIAQHELVVGSINFPVVKSATNSLPVVTWRHIYENCCFRKASRNRYCVFFQYFALRLASEYAKRSLWQLKNLVIHLCTPVTIMQISIPLKFPGITSKFHYLWALTYCHVTEWRQTGLGLTIGLIEHLYNPWLHLTNHYYTQTGVLSHVASNGGRSSASGLTSSQDGDHLTPTSYSHCRVLTLNWTESPNYISLYSLGTDRIENFASHSPMYIHTRFRCIYDLFTHTILYVCQK
jgi:hypothetical protein